jgi:NAD+ diphosphatase
MILPPLASPQDFKAAVLKPETYSDINEHTYWFIYSGTKLLVSVDGKKLPSNHDFILINVLYIGTLKGIHLFSGEIQEEIQLPNGYMWSQLMPLHATLDETKYSIAGRALQLLQWDRSNKYCGFCGTATLSREHERCRECPSCGQLAYPKQSIAILALITKEDQILLARSPQFPDGFYSILAGFVEPGETLEQCVIREVFEEVGITVKNVRYFANQPWPLSNSLMIGFSCEWQEGDIQIDPAEIEDAAWFNVNNLPQLPPTYSLARLQIEEYIKETES